MYFDVGIQEKFENTKVFARSRKSKKYRPNNDQKKKYKGQTNNGLQSSTHKTNDRATRAAQFHM